MPSTTLTSPVDDAKMLDKFVEICQEIQLGNIDEVLDSINVSPKPENRQLIKSVFHDIHSALSDVMACLGTELKHIVELNQQLNQLSLCEFQERAQLSISITKRFLRLPIMLRRAARPEYKSDLESLLNADPAYVPRIQPAQAGITSSISSVFDFFLHQIYR